jgi:HAD superfamily hydrolase (TIGR01509 family)
MKVKAVIFDMDGVLVNSEIYWPQEQEDFLKSVFPDWDDQDQEKLAGMKLMDVYELMKKKYGIKTGKDEFIEIHEAMADKIYQQKVSLLPNVLEAIKMVKKLGLKTAIASSSKIGWINTVVKRFEIGQYFDEIVSGDYVKKGKPAPDIYLLAAERLGLTPEECIGIEDSEKGVASVKAAGMTCIGIKNGVNDAQDITPADVIIHDFNELEEVIKRL